MFAETDSFLELIAEESLNDASALLLPKEKPFSVELHMITKRGAIAAFQVFAEWSGAEPDRANVVCIERQTRAKGGRGRANGGRTAAPDVRREFDFLRVIAELSAKVDLIGDIAAGFAHEIRNPLTTVRGFVQLLRPSLSDIGKEQYADIVLSEINRANDILNQFMNCSRPPAPQRKPVEAGQLIKQAMSELEEEAAAAGCDVRFRNSSAPLSLYVDVLQIRQALINLIRNGIDAVLRGGAGGSVEIEAVRAEDGVQIRVRDNGIGMDPKTLSRLFVPFFTTKDGALGLGLTACRRIVENHGGTLMVESLPGKGSTFVIQFTHHTLQEE